MKSIDLSNIVETVRRMPANKDFFNHLISAYEEGIAELIESVFPDVFSVFYGGVILNGCEATDEGADYSITSGFIYVFADRKIYEVPARSGVPKTSSLYQFRLTQESVGSTFTFTDGNAFQVTKKNQAEFINEDEGLGGDIVSDFFDVSPNPDEIYYHTFKEVLDELLKYSFSGHSSNSNPQSRVVHHFEEFGDVWDFNTDDSHIFTISNAPFNASQILTVDVWHSGLNDGYDIKVGREGSSAYEVNAGVNASQSGSDVRVTVVLNTDGWTKNEESSSGTDSWRVTITYFEDS